MSFQRVTLDKERNTYLYHRQNIKMEVVEVDIAKLSTLT